MQKFSCSLNNHLVNSVWKDCVKAALFTKAVMDGAINGGIRKSKKKKQQKIQPSHFISIQISNPKVFRYILKYAPNLVVNFSSEIHSRISELQNHAVLHTKEVECALERIVKMHITLDVIKLHDSSCEEKAKSALKSIVKQANLEGILPVLEIHGVKTFSNRVVYASFLPNGGLDQLKRLAEICRTELTNYQVIRTDLRAFHPHITLMKVSHKNYKVLKKIPPECHSNYEEAHFGTEHVRSIQLCSMTCEENGYYSVLEELHFNHNNETCISASDDSLSDDKSRSISNDDTSMLLGKSDKNVDRKLPFAKADKLPCDGSKLSSSDSN